MDTRNINSLNLEKKFMEAIKLFGTSHNGKLTVSVPEEFDEKELEIMIVSSKEKKANEGEMMGKKRNINELMSIAGSAKHPDSPTTNNDAYDQ
jgi:hypothetical protein